MIKTYRGNLADGGQDRIRLKTLSGDIGYRIIKFQLFPATPGSTDYENVVKIFKLKQSSVTAAIDFTDGDVLAAGYVEGYSGNADTDEHTIVFDQEVFNQDIYITNKDVSVGENINYYLELEQIKLNENQSTMATLQSLRRLALPRN